MGKQETLARWKALAGDASDRAWQEEDLDFFLHRFRPLGDGLDEVFAGVQLGQEILPRLKEVYEATAEDYQEGEPEPLFVVRHAKPASERRLAELAGRHFQRMGQIGKAVGIEEVNRLLAQPPALAITAGKAPETDEASPQDARTLEACAEFMKALEPVASEALLLKDSLYYLASDYLLGYYILWPLYLHQTDIQEPFQPWFELWKLGGQLRIESAEQARLFVPDML
jgi:hypothetical protein